MAARLWRRRSGIRHRDNLLLAGWPARFSRRSRLATRRAWSFMRKDQNRLFGARLIANADARVLFKSRAPSDAPPTGLQIPLGQSERRGIVVFGGGTGHYETYYQTTWHPDYTSRRP